MQLRIKRFDPRNCVLRRGAFLSQHRYFFEEIVSGYSIKKGFESYLIARRCSVGVAFSLQAMNDDSQDFLEGNNGRA